MRAAFGLGAGASELFGLSQGPAASISASRLDEMFLGHRNSGRSVLSAASFAASRDVSRARSYTSEKRNPLPSGK